MSANTDISSKKGGKNSTKNRERLSVVHFSVQVFKLYPFFSSFLGAWVKCLRALLVRKVGIS